MNPLVNTSAVSTSDAPTRRIARHAIALMAVTTLTLATAGLWSPTAQAQAPASTAPAPSAALTAFADFKRAAQGEEAAIEPTADTFARLSAATPSDVVLLAYAGSTHAMRARTTLLPWKKMGYADDGLAQLDKALALLTPAHDAPAYRGIPAVLDVKFTAASTFLALPGMFHRQERGQKLLAEVAASPLLKSSPAPFQAAVAAAQQKAQGN